MSPLQVGELLLLASLWGASFLLMRLGAGEFGPVALAAVRVIGATLFLLPLLAARRETAALKTHWRELAVIGLTNSALPFLAYSYAALSLPAGLSSIFNATTPMFAAVIAWLWLGDRLTAPRVLGLMLGFAGVAWLVFTRGGLAVRPGDGSTAAMAACLCATLCYGFAASYTKRRLSGVAPMAVAAGSQLAAALMLAVPAALTWPATMPSTTAWVAAGVLAVASTGIAYILYFHLIVKVGPANAVSVTFLIPLFAVLWGAVFLSERVTGAMAVGCAVILAGTALTTGVIGARKRRAAPASG